MNHGARPTRCQLTHIPLFHLARQRLIAFCYQQGDISPPADSPVSDRGPRIQSVSHRLDVRMDVLHRGSYVGVIENVLGEMNIPLWTFHEAGCQEVPKAMRRHFVSGQL